MVARQFLALMAGLTASVLPCADAAPCGRWSPLNGGMSGGISYPATLALFAFGEGSGAALYAGGNFTHADGVAVFHLARWDGVAFSGVDGGVSFGQVLTHVLGFAAFDDGSGEALFLAGDFTRAGGIDARHVAKWDGCRFSALGDGLNWGPYAAQARAFAVFDDANGPALYVGGYFTHAGDTEVNHIARWDGASWSAVGGGFNAPVHGLAVFDDSSGSALYAAGNFTRAGGAPANFIAKWDGFSWQPLGEGVNASLQTLAVFDDGTGPALYAGGAFTSAGGVPANRVARWNGTSWTPLGRGIQSALPFPTVEVLAIFDDGEGPALYAGGQFQFAGGEPANNIARWNGGWSALGSGVGAGDSLASVYALAPFASSTGSALYAGGLFTRAGEVSANYVAAWTPCGTDPAVLRPDH